MGVDKEQQPDNYIYFTVNYHFVFLWIFVLHVSGYCANKCEKKIRSFISTGSLYCHLFFFAINLCFGC